MAYPLSTMVLTIVDLLFSCSDIIIGKYLDKHILYVKGSFQNVIPSGDPGPDLGPGLDRNPRGDNPRPRRSGRKSRVSFPASIVAIVVSSTLSLPSSRLAPPPPLSLRTLCRCSLLHAANTPSSSWMSPPPLSWFSILLTRAVMMRPNLREHYCNTMYYGNPN
jgi:hypothetical protein